LAVSGDEHGLVPLSTGTARLLACAGGPPSTRCVNYIQVRGRVKCHDANLTGRVGRRNRTDVTRRSARAAACGGPAGASGPALRVAANEGDFRMPDSRTHSAMSYFARCQQYRPTEVTSLKPHDHAVIGVPKSTKKSGDTREIGADNGTVFADFNSHAGSV